jgi:CheY-like chemotaxis protein
LNDTVEGILKMLRRLIGEDIDLAWMPGHDLWHVKIDPSQIDQILANLAVNARDAIAGAGKITMETDNATLDEAYCADHLGFEPGQYVLLAVSDNGSGMSKGVLEHLFEPFFTTKELGKGTGLGLSSVYGVVKQNGGFVNVYSEPGKGTTFEIYLPRFDAEDAAMQVEVQPEPLQGGTETVLMVEDEAPILETGKAMLERLGYKVLAADTPDEAIRLAGEGQGAIHLLFTDVVMPGMNGKELEGRIKAIHPSLKCLYMSGYTANAIAHHGVLDEGVHFIHKPFTMKELAARVREALGKG